jgi:hypothetical protein
MFFMGHGLVKKPAQLKSGNPVSLLAGEGVTGPAVLNQRAGAKGGAVAGGWETRARRWFPHRARK